MKYQHWSKISTNPINPNVMQHVQMHLENLHIGPRPSDEIFFKRYVKEKSVLDIGVVEHDISFINRPGWKHKTLKDLASKIVGVDVLKSGVDYLVNQGFDVRLCDATSDEDIGERFDTVYIGDVIEHVNDPVKLLKFASRHTNKDGQIVVTTPCPFWWRNLVLMFKNKTYIGNVDHICWITPLNALEIGSRAGLDLDHYYTVETEGSSILRKSLKWVLELILGRSEIFTWAYAYVYKKP